MTKSKSFNKSPKHRALYHDLMESILKDEDAMDEGVTDKLKKRKPDDTNKDKGPSDSSKEKSLATSSKSSKTGKSAKDQVGEDLDNIDEQPKNDWYKKSSSESSPDPEWNEGKSVDDGLKQSWLNDMAKATKPPLTFDELMHTPIDFSTFVMNRLKINNLTKEILVGPAYNLLKGTCKSYVELDYTMEECYRALSEQLDWNNLEGHRCPYDLTKSLPMQMSSQASTTKSNATRYELHGIEDMVPNLWSPHDVYSTKRILSITSVKVNKRYEYGHLEEIIVKRADQQLYIIKEGDFKRRRLNDIEDMLLLIGKNKLNNLDGNVIVHLAASLHMYRRPAYTTLSDPQGVIYEDKLKRKRYMRADELYHEIYVLHIQAERKKL
ncbi:hypothetical protein Tco_0829269 [Tanacetum coccineum]